MKAHAPDPQRLDIRAFAQDQAQLTGELTGSDLLLKMKRLPHNIQGLDAQTLSKNLHWGASGYTVAQSAGAAQTWLHLNAQLHLPMQCQRCLQAMDQRIEVDRRFRFLRDEAEIAAQDDEAEEDLLVSSKQFNLLELIEDELLMALPFAPMHEACPEIIPYKTQDKAFEAALQERPHAFSSLAALKSSSHP